jgi:hypothetical protein
VVITTAVITRAVPTVDIREDSTAGTLAVATAGLWAAAVTPVAVASMVATADSTGQRPS